VAKIETADLDEFHSSLFYFTSEMKILLCIFFSLASLLPLHAQEDSLAVQPTFPDSTLHVSKIIIAGNEKTKDFVITREMSLKVGSLITRRAIAYDINRIYSLRLFNRVDIHVIPDSTMATLFVLVNERWFFYPYPIFGLKDHSWSHLYYGLGVVHSNFRGRNEQLYAQFALGYDPFVSFQYVNPLIEPEWNLFLNTKFEYGVIKNKSLISLQNGPEFDERHLDGQVIIGKRLSLFSTASASIEYTSVTVSDNRAGRTLSPTGTDSYFSFNAGYQYDTRDLGEYPGYGTLLSVSGSKLGYGQSEVNYQRYNFDYRRYIPTVGGIVLAARAFGSAVQGGTVPNYGHVYYGYNERIRGRFKTILEGENIFGGNAELHFPIISPSYFRSELIPIEQFRVIRYALYFALFADGGDVWYRDEPFALDRFLGGYGFGFHFLLSYSAIARIEYAFPGNAGKGELILDIGAAF
jgi:outer membrane protein assembly factor BamA